MAFKRLAECTDEEVEGLEANTVRRARNLRQVLYKLYDLAQNGKLNQAVADLPEYYIALDRVSRRLNIMCVCSFYTLSGDQNTNRNHYYV